MDYLNILDFFGSQKSKKKKINKITTMKQRKLYSKTETFKIKKNSNLKRKSNLIPSIL